MVWAALQSPGGLKGSPGDHRSGKLQRTGRLPVFFPFT